MKIKFLVCFIIVFLVLFLSYSNHAFAASFKGIGDLPGGSIDSRAYGVSADGSVVAGLSRSSAATPNFEAFRWTESGGMVGIGDLDGGIFHSEGVGISGDGSTVVGLSYSELGAEAFRWESGSMVSLNDPLGDIVSDYAWDASSDGSVIVGWGKSTASGSYNEAYRWTESGGMVGLGDLSGGLFDSQARGVSADGSVVIGYSKSTLGTEAFRWESGSMVGLGDLDGGGFGSYASDVSADGSVVVGWSYGEYWHAEAIRWTEDIGLVSLGDLPGGLVRSEAIAVSGDGSVVVGKSDSYSGNEVFIWDETTGIRSLTDVLYDLSLDMTGWTLYEAKALSYDGKTIVGYGSNPDGQLEGWIANLEPSTPAVPEPTTMLLLGSGLIGLAGFRRKMKNRRQ